MTSMRSVGTQPNSGPAWLPTTHLGALRLVVWSFACTRYHQESCLLPLTAPVLFVRGADDVQCPLPMLLDACGRMASPDVRVMEVPGVDGALRTPNARSVWFIVYPSLFPATCASPSRSPIPR